MAYSSFAMGTPAFEAPRSRWRLSIAAWLGIGIGALMFAAVGGVVAINLYANFANTTELLRDKSRMLLGSLSAHLRREIEPTVAQVNFVADQIERGDLDPDHRERLLDLLRAVLAGSPLIEALLFFDVDGTRVVAARRSEGFDGIPPIGSWRDDPAVSASLAEAEARPAAGPYWGPPVHVPDVGTVLNLRRPVRRNDEFVGMVVGTVPVAALSTFIAGLATEFGQNAFILYDRRYVLAHLALEGGFPGLSREQPLPRVSEIGDPVLARIWRDGWEERGLMAGSGHSDRIAGTDYIFLYTPIEGYGDAPWLVGSYFAEEDVGTQFQRLAGVAAASAGGLALAVIGAVLFGRAVRGPIERLARAAQHVRGLDLEQVPRLPRSRFRELDMAGAAFNAMVATLRAFALYVPRDLVRRLLARGDVATLTSEVREVTVMFTDIAGFTSSAERMGAQATAAFLNQHFDLVTVCIEAEDGIVDKFLGDGVMALWGAVEDQPDHAARGARAALAIARAVRADNARRRERVRLRIGLHSGPVVVGNIGSRSRMNYTVVGDAVNTADRLQHLGKELLPGGEATILVSDSTRRGLEEDVPLHPLGRHRLRGRDEPTEVFALAV